MSLTPEQITTVVDILKTLPPGLLPLEIFAQIARIGITTTVEMVPLILEGNRVKVLLTKRPDDDPDWPGMVHVPGSIILSTDKPDSLETVFNRILNGELAGEPIVSGPNFMNYSHHQTNRGREVVLIHWIEMKNNTSGMGTYYYVDELPDNITDHQISFIQKAAEEFKSLKNN